MMGPANNLEQQIPLLFSESWTKKIVKTDRSLFVFSESEKSEKSPFLLFKSGKSSFRRGGFQRRLARHFAAVADGHCYRLSVHAVG